MCNPPTRKEGQALDGVGHGTVLAGRYRLQERVETTPDGAVWHAVDETLDRSVSIRVMHRHHIYAADVADAARRAALVDDARLARVLDVSTQGELPFIVTERIEGVTLVDLTAGRGLDAELARRVIGELAQALARAGDRGLHHLRLSPGRVFVRPDGTVKLLGTAVDASAAGMDEYDPEIAGRVDAVELVALLYYALTRRWPIDDAGGPGRVPTITTDVPAPADLVGGVPDDLDRLCAGTLGPNDDGPRDPAELVRALGSWTSPAPLHSAPGRSAPPPAPDPAGQHAAPVDTRVMEPVPAIADPRPAGLPHQSAAAPVARQPAEQPRPHRHRDGEEESTGPPTPGPPWVAGNGAEPTGGEGEDGEDAWWIRAATEPDAATGTGSFPLLSPQPAPPPRDQPKRVVLGVAALVAVLLVFAVWSLRDFGDSGPKLLSGDPTFSTPPSATGSASADPTPSTASPSTSASTAAGRLAPTIEQVTAIDPQSSDGDENGKDAANTIDGRKGTSWRSQFYKTPEFGGLKDGVGLVLDLGRRSDTSAVTLRFAGDGGRVELRSSKRATYKGSTRVAAADLGGSPVTVRPDTAVRSRYLVLWFTRLTRVGGENRLDISDISVS